MTHTDLLEAVWESVPPGAVPERFAERRDWLLERVGAGAAVLDLGCGEGLFASALTDQGARVVAVDVVAEPLRRAGERDPRLDLRLAPLEGPLPLDDETIDVAWLGETIEHVPDPVGTLHEVRRVLRPQGHLLLSTPDHPPELLRRLADDPEAFAEHFDPRADHLRFFNEVSLRGLVEELGFGDVEIAAEDGTLLLCAHW